MPKRCVDYSRTMIYKLVCNDVEVKDIYIGHTTNFVKRKYNHQLAYYNTTSNNHNCFVYQFMRSSGGFSNWSMIEIEKYPCNDLHEALKRERYWMEKLKATLNKNVPGRTRSEWYELHKHEQNENCKQYTKLNKKRIVEYKQQYYKKTKKNFQYIKSSITSKTETKYFLRQMKKSYVAVVYVLQQVTNQDT